MYFGHGKLWIMLIAILFGITMVGTGPIGAQTIHGTTGLVNIPSASVAPSGSISAGYYWFNENHHLSTSLGAFPGVEVGLGAKLANSNATFSGDIKVQLLEEADYPAVAVGLHAKGSKVSYYIVGSMQLGAPGVRGHAGFGTGKNNNWFFGISTVLNPVSVAPAGSRLHIPVTTLSVEFDGSDLNAGLLFKFNQNLSGKFMLTNLSRWGLGVSFGF